MFDGMLLIKEIEASYFYMKFQKSLLNILVKIDKWLYITFPFKQIFLFPFSYFR